MADLFDFVRDDAAVPEAPAAAPRVLSVSQLSAAVKGTLEAFGPVVVQGEVSGAKLAASGHFYADLKDDGAVLGMVAWRGTVQRWGGVPENGALVVVRGKLTTYPGRSQYQLVADSIELAGLGALMQQLEALKRRLAAEGLFDEGRKRPLPLLPRRIGIVTSPRGSVIQDMLHRLAERCPRDVIVWPVTVQGAQAAGEVADAVAGLNRLPEGQRPDVVIVARGGGSFEDLMPFNDERVVRAVAASGIPVISGVGHEPDVTLCDLAADVRAPTPTGAAEYVVPVAADLIYTLDQHRRRLVLALRGWVTGRRERVGYLQRLLPDPRRQLVQASATLDGLQERLAAAFPRMLAARRERVEGLARVLASADPRAPLARGYAFVTAPDGRVVRRASDAAGRLNLHFTDGNRMVEVVHD